MSVFSFSERLASLEKCMVRVLERTNTSAITLNGVNLKLVDPHILRMLKGELKNFNMNTGKWK